MPVTTGAFSLLDSPGKKVDLLSVLCVGEWKVSKFIKVCSTKSWISGYLGLAMTQHRD